MPTVNYISGLLEAHVEKLDHGHMQELERRAYQAFAAQTQLEKVPNLEPLRIRLQPRQVKERLDQARADRHKKLEILDEQRRLQANYCSAVLLAHEIQRQVKFTWDYMAVLLKGNDERIDRLSGHRPEYDPLSANNASLALLHQKHCPDPDATEKLLDTVPDLLPGSLQNALREVYNNIFLADSEQWFAAPLDLSFIEIRHPATQLMIELEQAYNKAASAWKSYEEARTAYIDAKASLNEPQFILRIEQAIRANDARKEAQINKEWDACRVQLYCATIFCNYFFDQLSTARGQLYLALETAVRHIALGDVTPFVHDRQSRLYDDKMRNNCICAKVLLLKMDKPGPRPDLSRIDKDIIVAVSKATKMRPRDPYLEQELDPRY